MTEIREYDKVHLGRLIRNAGERYESARIQEKEAERLVSEIQRIMDYAGLVRVEAFPYIAARPQKGTKIRLEKMQ